MLHIIKERLHQKYRTLDYPRVQPQLSDRFCGLPVLAEGGCPQGCTACRDVCPTGAIQPGGTTDQDGPVLDMGRCLFCAACRDACPQKRIAFSQEHRLARFARQDLRISAATPPPAGPSRDLSMFSRSFKLRQVSAGGCNACEADCNVLTTLVFDLVRFGIDFVAAPRHADAIVVTGPVSENMRVALWDTYYATPEPRVVVAVGVCAISGGVFAGSPECHDGLPPDMPVDVYIPGCPPNPWTILDGLLMAAGKKF